MPRRFIYHSHHASGDVTSDDGHPVTPQPPSTTYFSDDFESDGANLVPVWDATSTTQPTLNTNLSFVHAGTKSGQFHYSIAAGGTPSQDSNIYTVWVSASALTHFFWRQYIYFKTPEIGLDTFIVQRKLLWWSDSTSAGVSQVNYANFITSYTGTGGTPTPTQIRLHWGGNKIGACAPTYPDLNLTTILGWDTWYSLEAEVQLNTSGLSDGILRVWLDGTQTYENTAMTFRGTCADVSYFSIGRQTNRTNSEQIDEYRYYDDVVISDSYIGP